MRPTPLGLLVLAGLSLLGSRAFGETQNGGAALLVDRLGVRVAQAVAIQPDTSALVLSMDTRSSLSDLYVQKTDRRGRPLFGPGGKLVWTAPLGTYPGNAIADGAGGIVFTWWQYRGATGQDVFVQRVLSDGTLAYGPTGLLVCNAAFDQTGAVVTAGPAGSFYVSWGDGRANAANQSDVYVQRYTLAGAAQLVANGELVNTVATRMASYYVLGAAPDLLGGLLLSWRVASPSSMHAQRLSSAGALLYGANGATLGDPSDFSATIAPDGSGGLWATTQRFVSSADTPYLHHLTSLGGSSFAAAGIAFHPSATGTFDLTPIRNASGGCFVYGLARSNTSTLGDPGFRQEVSATGAVLRGLYGEQLNPNVDLLRVSDSGSNVLVGTLQYEGLDGGKLFRLQRFAYDGTPAFPGTGLVVGRNDPTVRTAEIVAASTATGLVIEAHSDGRFATAQNSFQYQLFGQALDSAGQPLWDDAENPVLSLAQDAPHDQGGLARIAWDGGIGDVTATRVVRGYRGWRALGSVPPAVANAPRPAADESFAAGAHRYLVHANLYWEMVAQSPAAQLGSYALTLATGQDSTSAGNADESFMIEAYDDSLHHWWSGALVTHSVDNLPPVTPAPFTGQYAAGRAYLHWNPNTEADLAGYRLYRGASPAFVTGPASLVASPPDTGWIDPAGSPAIYKLTAIDVHGNESPVATLVPAGTLGVGGGTPAALAFALGSGNPSRHGATLRLALPAAARVRLAVYDAAGREVRNIADGARPAGEWTFAWDGANASGQPAPSGLYFARLETGERTVALRLVLTR